MMLSEIKGLANARLTKKFLETLVDLEKTIDFGHTTQGNVYTPTEVAHPMRWFVRQYGTIAIGGNAIPISTVLARRDKAVLAKIDGWNGIAPKLDLLVNLVGCPPQTNPTAVQLKTFWQAIFQLFATSERLAKDNLQDLWSEAASDGQTPDVLHSGTGDLPLTDVYVTSSANLARRARAQGKTAVTLDTETLKLWLQKGAMDLEKLFKPDWDESLTAPVGIETAVPELVSVLSKEAKQSAMSRSVRGLKLVIEVQAQPIPCLHWQGVLILDSEQLDRLPRTPRLTTIIDEAAAAGWLKCSVDEARRLIADAQVEENRAKVAAGSTLEERLLLAVGNRTEPMTESLGDAPSKVIPKECEPLQIAKLVLAMLGPTILQRLAPTLSSEGLQPPSRWGTDEARAFVNALGFPETFAAAPESRREAEETISGPIELPPLHDYQEEVVTGLRQLFLSGTGRRRAVVSLPTGGGKTRVTVQAATDLVLKPEGGNRTVLWVAQTDELCEQAVQSFRQVWLNRGAQRTDLRIVRLCGGNGTPSADTQGKPVVVIASIQTLNSRIGKDELKWLATPGLVVIDECHHAIAPSYTGLLKFLDAEAPRPGSQSRDEPPVIGLSATPFRSANDDDESLRLAKRFDQSWLPAGQKELHDQLTERGILAVANHEKLKSPSVVSPDLIKRFEEVGESETFQLESLLEELNRHLANDDDRNQLLVETIKNSDQQSILFFANSVDHAQEMAARLNLVGVAAAAISGDTPTSARRYFLDRFQRGDVRVLCNHSVLTTGFDAPRTDMVLIARQVQSPVRYMQMVGRGLRGVKNGGTEACRIVTVMENLGRFGEKHPYHFCAKYFSFPPEILPVPSTKELSP
jgi:superfamily II DNA or RNA helicase